MIYIIEAPTLRGPFKTRKLAVFSGHVMFARISEHGSTLTTNKVTTIPRART